MLFVEYFLALCVELLALDSGHLARREAGEIAVMVLKVVPLNKLFRPTPGVAQTAEAAGRSCDPN